MNTSHANLKQATNIRVAWGNDLHNKPKSTGFSGRSNAGDQLGGGFVVGSRPSKTRPPSGVDTNRANSGRPSSSRVKSNNNMTLKAMPSNSSIAAYKKLKSAGLMKTERNGMCFSENYHYYTTEL